LSSEYKNYDSAVKSKVSFGALGMYKMPESYDQKFCYGQFPAGGFYDISQFNVDQRDVLFLKRNKDNNGFSVVCKGSMNSNSASDMTKKVNELLGGSNTKPPTTKPPTEKKQDNCDQFSKLKKACKKSGCLYRKKKCFSKPVNNNNNNNNSNVNCGSLKKKKCRKNKACALRKVGRKKKCVAA